MNKKTPIMLTIMSMLVLSGCSIFPSLTSEGVIEENFYQASNGFTTLKEYKEQIKFNNNVYLPSIGEQKLLVGVVNFTDSSLNSNLVSDVNKAFFGQSTDTGYESLASFYQKSSYNQLLISGEVKEFNINKSSSEIRSENANQSPTSVVNFIYDNLDEQLLKSYDIDNDGFVDAFYLIYNFEFSQKGSNDFYWAYTTSTNAKANLAKPRIKTYAWSSSYFMYQDYSLYKGLNSETYIHEFGHILGLEDYYDYQGEASPLGVHDMMDGNHFDHNAYTKYLLGWTTPYVIKDTTSLILEPGTTSGQSALLNLNFNNSPFDEYILIEYFTSTGLNKLHSTFNYYQEATKTNIRPLINGVRVYHVDSRLYQATKATAAANVNLGSVIDDLDNLDNDYFGVIGASNSKTRFNYSNFNLITHLDSQGNDKPNHYSSSEYLAKNESLFFSGDKIEDWSTILETKKNTFNDGAPIDFSFEVEVVSPKGVKLNFVNLTK